MNKAIPMPDAAPPVPRTVLIAPYQSLNWLYRPLMVRMREKWDVKLVLLLPDGGGAEAEYRPLIGPLDVIETFSPFDELMAKHGSDQSDAEAFAEARSNEVRYNINYVRDIFQQERGVARGLVAGPPLDAFVNGSPPSIAKITRTANEFFKFYEALFERHPIDVAMVWPRTGNEAICAIVAEQRGIPVTYPYTAKYKHYAYWSSGASCGNIQHKLAYEQAGDCEPLPTSQIVPPARPSYLEQGKMAARYSFRNILKKTIWNCVDRVLLLRNDFLSGRLGKARRLPLSTVIKKIWSESIYFQSFQRMCERDFSKLVSEPYVLFAFQNEPEFSVQMRCKEFNDQGAIIRQMALSMPAGVRLIIKEHTWLGGHSLGFYRDLVSLPNVLMAHPEIRAIDLIPNALAVASLASTVTLEAAMFGKPAMIFSDRSEFAFLPSVRTVRALTDLADVLRGVTAADTKQALTIRKEAARLIKATEAIGFEARPYFTRESGNLELVHVDRAMDLLRSLIALHQRERSLGRANLDAQRA
jgi:hypothetical protein